MSIHRLYALYDLSTPSERISGRTWYCGARATVNRLAKTHGVDPKIVAGVLAALSPNARWSQNQIDANALLSAALAWGASLADYHELTVSTYNANKLKAWTIVDLRDSTAVLATLRGPKVTAFYRNLIGDETALTLDTHAYNAFCGYRATGSDLPGIKAKIERKARAAYIRAAFKKHETTSAFQAIIWVTWRARVRAGKVTGYARNEI